MFELKIVTHFSAAHQLRMVAQKCENLHGHNWKIEVVVAGDALDHSGVLLDFGIVKRHVREILEQLDHRFLNELDLFGEPNPPSSENIAVFIAKALQTRLGDPSPVKVTAVTAWESENASATYRP